MIRSVKKRRISQPMASCKLGHIYIINTVLSKPPKEKYAVCVCVADQFFIWINTEPRPHAHDQLPLLTGCHELVKHDSYVDCSKIFRHPDFELDDAKEFARISDDLCKQIIAFIENGVEVLPQNHADLILENLRSLL